MIQLIKELLLAMAAALTLTFFLWLILTYTGLEKPPPLPCYEQFFEKGYQCVLYRQPYKHILTDV